MKKYSNVFGNDHEQPALLRDLEREHADQAVVPEEPGDLDGERRCVQFRIHRQVGDGQVVDVERLVVVLVVVEVEVGELLEDRLVGGVDDEARSGSPAAGTAG